jgi:hypothetical protein
MMHSAEAALEEEAMSEVENVVDGRRQRRGREEGQRGAMCG